MRVLVIGGAGYIGSHVARTLLDRDHEVCVFDNLSTGLERNLFREAGFFKGDILTTAELNTCMAQGFDAIVHLAALKAAGESMTAPEKYSVNNISGTINILNAALDHGIRRMIFSSSAAVYGEPRYVPVDESHPTNPENYYGFTKLEIERIMSWYSRLKQFSFAALRYFNAAGYDPDQRIGGLEQKPGNLLPRIMEVAVGMRSELEIYGNDYPTPDGTCIRDYIHVSDLADAHVLALDALENAKNEQLVLNLGSESGISVMEMIETARRVTGQPIPARTVSRRPGDPAKLVASAAGAHKNLGWSPAYSDPETLIRTTWDAYERAQGTT